MQVYKCSSYSNKSFNGWNIHSTCFAEKTKAIAKIAKEQGKEVAEKCVNLFNELGSNSPHHHLYIDETQYAVFGHHPCASSFLKSRFYKSFPKILKEMQDFVSKDAPKIEKAELFKKRISPILLVRNENVLKGKRGWNGDIEMLKDKLATDVAFSRDNFKTAKKIYHSLNRINRFLNQKKLFLDVSSHRGEFLFEISVAS